MNHLAIMRNPWFQYVLDGKKTIESRATKVKCAPYGKVHKNDVIYFKESGDFAVISKAIVGSVFYTEDPMQIQKLLNQNIKELCITNEFIDSKKDCRYLSLFWLTNIEKILPFPFVKHDRRAWIVDFKKELVKER